MRINDGGSLTLESCDDVQAATQAIIDFGNNRDPGFIDSLGSADKISLGSAIAGEGATLTAAATSLQSLYDNIPVGG